MLGIGKKWGEIHRKGLVFSIALILVILVGFLKIVTGTEYAFSLLFFIPILGGCWYINAKAGYLLAVASALIWLIADLNQLGQFSHNLVPIVNESLRLIVFLAGVYLLSTLKEAIAKEKTIAMTDPLTGVLNRRAFERMAQLELDRFRRYGIPFSVLFFDVDNFKTINDTFGHQTGDRLLRRVAEVVQSNIRSIDTFSRIGGDEFILILSGAEKNLACSGVRKIRNVLQAEMSLQGWAVTFSIGVVIYLTPPADLHQLIDIADAAMYTAKLNGKNQDEYREFML